MMIESPVVDIRGVGKAFPNVRALADLTFDVRRGEVFVILGGSGSGKSTLLKNVIGLHRPLAGTVEIDGEELTAATGEARLAVLRKFGILYQSSALFSGMTVAQNVGLPLSLVGVPVAEAAAKVTAMLAANST